jgi:hypothetical protein
MGRQCLMCRVSIGDVRKVLDGSGGGCDLMLPNCTLKNG